MWIAVLLLSTAFAGIDAFDWDEPTALDDYVNFDDGYFDWSILTTYRFDQYQTTVYMLNMTSQKWMDEMLTSRSIWYHMVAVAVPDVIRHEAAFMWIEGGRNGPDTGPAPPNDDLIGLIVTAAVQTGAIGSYVLQVPNQPMTFTNDPTQSSRTEDEITAWTWLTFITTHQNQPEVVLRLPMTKAVKRAFDTVQELLAQERPGTNINKFIPAGGSKRGWTTWSIAASDRRVIAAAPCVMSLLNFNQTLENHYRNLGGAWSFALYDYWIENITMHFHDDIVLKSPGGLWDYEDMFRYKERLGLIPKLLISATGDEYFMLTDSHAWWEEMPGPKWIDMIPNEGHSLGNSKTQALNNIICFMNKVLNDQPMPQLDWLRVDTDTGGLIRFYTDVTPDDIAVWQAFTWINETRKDFRQHAGYPPTAHPVEWQRVPLADLGFGYYLVEINTPDVGFTGYFFEVTYIQENGLPLVLTSEAHVTPSLFPGQPCFGEACHGNLV